MADKIVVLRAGRIEQVGAPMDLYRDPANRFVAGFIGSPAMNFLEGRRTAAGVEVPALRATLPIARGEGGAVLVGLRPEHLALDPSGDAQRVDLTEALGGVSYAHLVAATGERLVVEQRGEARARRGDRAGLVFDPARAMLFDAETGARIRAQAPAAVA